MANVIDRALARWRDGKKAADPDALRDVLATELLAELDRGNSAALELQAGLTDLLWQLGGVEAAIEATAGEVRENVVACFGELRSQQDLALEKLRIIDHSQRCQERRLRDQARQIEEMTERLRLFTRWLDVVLYGFTRSNPGGHVGFLDELRRANVAFTRARRQLVLVGDMHTLTQARDERFRDLACSLRAYLAEHGDIRQYREVRERLARLAAREETHES